MEQKRLVGARVVLRPWTDEDLPAFAAMNADPEVMRYFRAPLSREESDKVAQLIRSTTDTQGWGWWALQVPEMEFAGFVGLSNVPFEASFTPAVEIGWRLARAAWGYGYATEGAYLALRYAFDELNLERVVSFTAVENMRSRHVMERLGMQHEQDFDHPRLIGHPLCRHALYAISKAQYTANNAESFT
jgi:3-dehydroquinate dehydratase / shikimate dehydrogenase